MVHEFHAPGVSAEEEDGVYYVSFFNEGDFNNRYLMFQKPDAYTEQDVKLGMDQVYIERDDQLYSSYGGMKLVEVRLNAIEVHLQGGAVDKLGNIDRIIVHFDLEEEEFSELLECLRKIFAGSNYYTENI